MRNAYTAARAPGGHGRFVVGSKAAVAVALLGLGLLGALPAMAAKHPWEDYDKRLEASKSVAALGSDLFGDSVSLQDGALSFSTTDVSLPGNNGLPVAFGRSYRVFNRKDHGDIGVMGDWAVDLPHITGTFADAWLSYARDGNRCSDTRGPPPAPSGFGLSDYFHGTQLQIPGTGGGQLLLPDAATSRPTDGKTYRWMTEDQIHISCLPSIQNGTGEGFLAVTPDGTRYWFDWMAQDLAPPLEAVRFDAGDSLHWTLNPRKTTLYATRVEDRFGNSVTYSYTNAWNQSAALDTIVSSDDRQISIGYVNGRIATANDGSHTWRYEYASTTSGRITLTDVIQPDGSRWDIDFAGFTNAEIRQTEGNAMVAGEIYRTCKQLEAPLASSTFEPVGSITHPSGATGTFTLDITQHGLSNVPVSCGNVGNGDTGWFGGNNPNDDTNLFSMKYYAFTLRQKQIAGPGLTPYIWDYAYSPNTSWFWAGNATFSYPVCTLNEVCYERKVCDGGPCEGASLTTVTGPNGEWTRYTFGNSFRYNEGKLLRTDRGTGETNILESVVNTYDLSLVNQAYPARFGYSQLGNDHFASSYHRPLVKRETTRQDETFTWQIETCGSIFCTDKFVNPTRVRKHSTLGLSRAEATAYDYDFARWVIRLPTTTTCVVAVPADAACDGDVMSTTTYDADLLPFTVSAFGKPQHTLTYYADGTLKTYKDGRNYITTLSSWFRGIPSSIVYPDATNVAAAVNDDGTIASVTNEVGAKTCYSYDAMGRLASIVYPSETQAGVCSPTDWNTETFSFTPSTKDGHGLATGHWILRRRLGDRHLNTHYDALWRPVLEEQLDYADIGSYLSQTVKTYDDSGRLAFQSYPQRGIGNYWDVTQGTHTTYDALGRVVLVEQDAELDLNGDSVVNDLDQLKTVTTYLTGFQTRVTNPLGFATTTSYMAYDQPTSDWPIAISHPEGVYTDIVRDPYGKPTSVFRRNSTGSFGEVRDYSYNGYQELCRAVEPETGATLMGYDAAGNLSWSASGLPASTACDLEGDTAAILARKAARGYDARNRIVGLSFPDGRGDQVFDYTADGLPELVTTINDDGAQVGNAYEYNKRRLLTGESVSRPGLYVWAMGYGYDANGYLATLTYPTGRSVVYTPNALGQPTQAGSYATGVSYFANGAVEQFTYGNGIVHTLTQNARSLPERSRDAYGSVAVHDDSLDYDPNGNVVAISDALAGAAGNRDMTYDGLDRLTIAVSPMFGTANYSYDVLDNLLRVKIGGTATRDHWYCYDGSNRLTNVMTGSCTGQTVMGLGYDVQGNLENKNGLLFDFDFGNRLRESGTATLPLETYRYDGHGRRIQSSHTDTDSIYSMYGQDGVLRYMEDYRQRKKISYIYLAGSLVAELEDPASASAAPVLSTSGNSTDGDYSVSWTAVSGTDHYRLEESVDNGPWQQIASSTARTWNASGQFNGNYRYRVRACKLGCSDYSAVGSVTVEQLDLPPPVLTVPSTGINGNYTVSWTAVAGAANYLLQESVNGGSTWTAAYSGVALSKAFSAKPTGSYSYRVQACNSAGCTIYSSIGTVDTVHPPSSTPALTVPANGHNGSYTISWGSVATATSYTLQQSANGGAWATVFNADGLSKIYSGVAAGSYAYRVRACNAAGCSAFTASQTVTVLHRPAAAPSLTVPADGYNGSYTISWGTVATATSYTLQQSANGGSWANTYSGANLSKAHSGVAAGSYAYRVRACNVAGCSAFTAAQTVTVLHKPATAPLLTVPADGHNGSYTISWGSVATATSYTLQQSANGGAWATVYNGAGLSKAYSGVAVGSYAYRVRACNAAGCSAFTAAKTVTVVHKPAVAPALTVPADGYNGSYTISWGSVATATSYTLQQSANGGAWATAYNAAGLSKAYSGVATGSYAYRVQACNVAGCSAFTAAKTVTVVHKPASPPTVTAPAANNTGAFTVTWTAVATTTRYELWQRLNGGAWSRIHDGAGTSKAVSGLGNGNYEYRAKACNAAGCSGDSAIGTTVVTHPPTGAPSVTAPYSVNAGSSFTVSWTSVSTATRYELQERRNGGTWSTIYNATGTSTSLTRSMNGEYGYQARGCNVGGCGPYSAERSLIVENLGGCNPMTQICNDPQVVDPNEEEI